MQKKKILYVITKSNWGGAQRYVYDLATSLPKEQFNVAVALGLPTQAGGSGILKEKLETSGVRVITLSSLQRDMGLIKDFSSFIEIFRIIKKECPHIIHLNSSKASLLGAIAARLYNVSKVRDQRLRVIFTAHGWAFREERSWLTRFFIGLFQWLTVVASHATTTVSEGTKNEMWFPFTKNKLITIKNAIQKPSFLSRIQAREELARKCGASANTFWIGTIAELTKNKGLKYAIPAVAEIVHTHKKPIVYFIIGSGEQCNELQTMIHEYKLERNVFLVDDKIAARLLPAFDCFLLPSIKEGLPYVLLEAGSTALPTIASDVGGIPEIIHNEETGILVPPRDSNAIANALLKFIQDDKTRKQYGEKLYNVVKNNFSFKEMLEKTIALY